jgi:hypothetical protein
MAASGVVFYWGIPFEITWEISVPRLSWAQWEVGSIQRDTESGFDCSLLFLYLFFYIHSVHVA